MTLCVSVNQPTYQPLFPIEAKFREREWDRSVWFQLAKWSPHLFHCCFPNGANNEAGLYFLCSFLSIRDFCRLFFFLSSPAAHFVWQISRAFLQCNGSPPAAKRRWRGTLQFSALGFLLLLFLLLLLLLLLRLGLLLYLEWHFSRIKSDASQSVRQRMMWLQQPRAVK
jgi:hypothetical protein